MISMKSSMAAPLLLSFLMHPPLVLAAQPQSGATEVRTLESGKTIEREMAAGAVHVYQIAFQAGQFLRAVVNQRGIDVVVIVTGPEGQKISEVDSPNGADGPWPVSIDANTPGIYRIEVRPLDKDAKSGRCDVKIEELLTAAEYGARLAEEKAAQMQPEAGCQLKQSDWKRLKQDVVLPTCSL